MQLRDVNYYSDMLISIDIYAQSHSKRALEGGRGGRCRTKCILINHHINKGGPSQVGGSYSWLGVGGEGHLPSCSASPMLVTEGHEGNDHILYTMPSPHQGCVSNRHWSDLKLHSPWSDG